MMKVIIYKNNEINDLQENEANDLQENEAINLSSSKSYFNEFEKMYENNDKTNFHYLVHHLKLKAEDEIFKRNFSKASKILNQAENNPDSRYSYAIPYLKAINMMNTKNNQKK